MAATPLVHDVESAFQKGQLGIEIVWGSPVAATIAVGAVTMNPSIKRRTTAFTPRGVLLPTVVITGREWTEVAFDGKATHTDFGLLVADVVSDAQVDPVTATNVYTVEAGGLQISGGIVTDWTLKGNRDEVTLSGKMVGKKATIAAPTSGLSPATQVPCLGPGVGITIDSVPITKMFEWTVSVANMWGGAFFVGNSGLANILQKAIDAKFSCKMENASQAATILGYGSGVQKAVVITITNGAKIITLTFNAVFGEPGSFSDEEGIYAIELNGTIMNTATHGIHVTNV